jgi:hypothetical protein
LCDISATQEWKTEGVAPAIDGSLLHRSEQSLIFALQQAIAASPLLGVSSLDSGRSRSGLFFCQIAVISASLYRRANSLAFGIE